MLPSTSFAMESHPSPTSQLAQQIGEGDPQAFADLLRGVGAQLHGVARGIVDSESAAAAAVSEVFVELVSRPARLQNARLAPGALLLLDVRSHALERRPRSGEGTRREEGQEPLRELDRNSPAAKALLGLPHAERVLLENLFWEGRSRRDSSGKLDLSVVEARRRGVRGLIAFGVRLGIPAVAALDVVAGEGEREAEVVLRELEEQAGDADTAVDLQPFGMNEELRLGLLEAFARIGESVAATRLPTELERKLARAYAGESGVRALALEFPAGETTQPTDSGEREVPEQAAVSEPRVSAEPGALPARPSRAWLWISVAGLGWLLALGMGAVWLFWDSELRAERSRSRNALAQAEEMAQKGAAELLATRAQLEVLQELLHWLGSPGLRAVALRPASGTGVGSATLFLAGPRGWRLLPAPGSRLGSEALEVEFWVQGEPQVVPCERVGSDSFFWFRGDQVFAGPERVVVFRRLQVGGSQARLRLLEGELAEPGRR